MRRTELILFFLVASALIFLLEDIFSVGDMNAVKVVICSVAVLVIVALSEKD